MNGEKLNSDFFWRTILWLLLAAVVTGAVAVAKDNADQEVKIAQLQVQYVDIQATLLRIESEVVLLRQEERQWHSTGNQH